MAQAKINTKQFIADIAQLADPDFDYSLYDNDGPDNVPNSGDDDGYVDGIMVVYAGCGAEWGSGNDNLWPHMGTLDDYEYTRWKNSAIDSFLSSYPETFRRQIPFSDWEGAVKHFEQNRRKL